MTWSEPMCEIIWVPTVGKGKAAPHETVGSVVWPLFRLFRSTSVTILACFRSIFAESASSRPRGCFSQASQMRQGGLRLAFGKVYEQFRLHQPGLHSVFVAAASARSSCGFVCKRDRTKHTEQIPQPTQFGSVLGRESHPGRGRGEGVLVDFFVVWNSSLGCVGAGRGTDSP